MWGSLSAAGRIPPSEALIPDWCIRAAVFVSCHFFPHFPLINGAFKCVDGLLCFDVCGLTMTISANMHAAVAPNTTLALPFS